MSQIDPIALARFMVMDGAGRLIEAFSGIPEGPLRESVIHMAETMRATYAGAPASQRSPDPLATLGSAFVTPPPPPPKRALPGPGPKTSDPATKAVELRLQGKFPHEIAKTLKMTVSAVYKAIGEARRAGVKLPDIGRAKVGLTHRQTVYITDVDQITGAQQVGAMNRAAEGRGITLEAYLARRKLALDMALEGRHIRAIVAATGENRAVLSQWYNTARAAGHVIPYMVDVQFVKPVPIEPERPTAEVIDLPRPKRNYDRIQGRFLLMMDELTDSNRGGVNRGAELLGVDVEEYLRRRRSALALYTQGVSPAEVARTVGITVKQAQNWKSRAEEAGVLTRPPHAPPLRPRSATRTKRGKLMTYVTEVEEFSSPGSRATAERAAHRLGLTLAAYLDKRRDALAMFRRDATSPEVADTLGIDMHHVTNWRAYALGAGLLKPFRAKA